MRHVSNITIFVSLLLPLPALAIPAITCHCFTDRSYDPARPALADPYFLATTTNSFLSAAFGVEKESIVIKKQTGVAADDLWIAYWLASRSGANPDSLLEKRKVKSSWQQVAATLTIRVKSSGANVVEALHSNVSAERLANAVVDELLLRYRLQSEPQLAVLRKAGAVNQEIIIASLLAAKSRRSAIELYRDVKEGKTSWGALLQRAKIEPGDIHSEFATLITAATSPKPLR